ncbi:S-methyl-5-thioribose-1-phosphate isomerase [Butyrivibrio sp. AE3004]|uniref:S-methyl-5-thioribose-1-phosphate isomerase n=1 Tax=Butyrivibrio sp. AE3004 TaxID=1506994 RepID=UPI0004944770|nr:S-methyl-5-thioribose-1-phosphate isomerase [Butyrivibrio sp. AE3004]
MKTILDYETVALRDDLDAVEIIDQTLLPGKIETILLKTGEEIWNAIYLLQVRGAPAIGVTAGFGLYILMKHTQAETYADFMRELKEKSDYLNSSRPTAVNLSWALGRMRNHVRECAEAVEVGYETNITKPLVTQQVIDIENRINDVEVIPKADSGKMKTIRDILILSMKNESERIKSEDIDVCRRIGENGLTLIKNGYGLLTHCNAGQLATCKYGTATAPMYLAHEKGYKIKVYCDETRPLLQGARLTAFELHSAGIDTTLLCDNMSASLMKSGLIDAIFVGCDRVAANGDAANKIGTSVVATVAKRYNIPFYVCAPKSTIDINTEIGAEIKIEQRKPEEVTEMWYKERMAPEGVKVYNPAFDVTDNELITAIITEHGVLRPPYNESIAKLFK